MSPRKLLLLICLTLSSSFVLEDFALAQRGGRSSGGGGRSSGSSAGRSSGGGRSMGSSAGRSSAGRSSVGSSRSSGRSSVSPTRSTSPLSGGARGYTPPSTSSSRTTTPSRTSTSSTLRTSPTTDLGRSSTSNSRVSPGISGSRSSTSSAPLDSVSAIERLTGRGSSSTTPSAPRTGIGTRTAPTTSPYDLSGRVSTFDSTPGARDMGLDQATVRMPSRTTPRTARTSTVPQPYSSRASTRAPLPSTSRRAALSERLREATAVLGDSGNSTRGLADRYSPSTNERSSLSSRLSDSSRSSRAREQAATGASRPGKSRLDALGRSGASAEVNRAENARSQARQERAQNGRTQRTEADNAAAEKRVASARKQYNEATAKDEALKKRMAGASTSAAIAGDIGLRAAIAANPLTGAYGGYYGNGNPWGGYSNGGWCNWYWNSCFPAWNNWWWGGCGFGFGFGWGWGNCWGGGYNPCWSWPCYYPSYGWNNCWPTYAFWSPAVVYSYVEVPVYTTVAEAPTATLVEPEATVERAPDFGKRAATEYMALGDRAFTEGRYGDAVHYYAKAIEFSPSDGVLYLVLSDALFATGDYHYAAFALRRSLELHPELASLGLDKRTFYGVPADFDKQLAVLERFVLDHPIDDDARLMLSANYLFSLQPEKSVQLLDELYSAALRESTGGQLIYAAASGALAGKN